MCTITHLYLHLAVFCSCASSALGQEAYALVSLQAVPCLGKSYSAYVEMCSLFLLPNEMRTRCFFWFL